MKFQYSTYYIFQNLTKSLIDNGIVSIPKLKNYIFLIGLNKFFIDLCFESVKGF